ncbi:MAG: hypothetical protein V1750_00075 [Acidobacteriota bacterium]
MATELVSITVTPAEWKLITALRNLPPSPLHDLLTGVLAKLVEFVREPHCPEMQADGVPCATPEADCEECMRLKEVLDKLALAIPGG